MLRKNNKVIIMSSTLIKDNFINEIYNFSKEKYKLKSTDIVHVWFRI